MFDRRITGRALSAGMEAGHTAVPALLMAGTNRPPQDGLLFHSGRGASIARARSANPYTRGVPRSAGA